MTTLLVAGTVPSTSVLSHFSTEPGPREYTTNFPSYVMAIISAAHHVRSSCNGYQLSNHHLIFYTQQRKTRISHRDSVCPSVRPPIRL
jgi:hypothetical protein